MSALGRKRTFCPPIPMSALPPKADIHEHNSVFFHAPTSIALVVVTYVRPVRGRSDGYGEPLNSLAARAAPSGFAAGLK